MAYMRVNWQDTPSVMTPISAANLNIMDAGVAANDTAISQITTNRKLDSAGNFTGTLNGMQIVAADPGTSTTVATHTAQLTDIVLDVLHPPVPLVPLSTVGDNNTVASPKLQNLINFASANGYGELFFPNGTFQYSVGFTYPNYLKFKGKNKFTSILQYTGTGNAIISGDRTQPPTYGTATYDLQFEDIQILGTSNLGTGLYITSHYMTFKNVIIQGFNIDFDCDFCWTNKFTDCQFNGNTIFKTGDQFNANSFVNCIFAGGKAFDITMAMNIGFEGCNFEGITDTIFYFEALGKVMALSMNGCYLENTAKLINMPSDGNLWGLSIDGNVIVTNGTGLAINLIVTTGQVVGKIKNNSFVRNNSDSVEAFVHMEGSCLIEYDNNKSYTFPSYLPVQLIDNATIAGNTNYMQSGIEYPNTKHLSGQLQADKGINMSYVSFPPGYKAGHMRYEPNTKTLHLVTADGTTAGESVLQVVRADTTANRPASWVCRPGMIFCDTTLSKPIWWDGSAWKVGIGNFVTVPATKTTAGNIGDFSADANYFYVCYSANNWIRIARDATW